MDMKCSGRAQGIATGRKRLAFIVGGQALPMCLFILTECVMKKMRSILRIDFSPMGVSPKKMIALGTDNHPRSRSLSLEVFYEYADAGAHCVPFGSRTGNAVPDNCLKQKDQ